MTKIVAGTYQIEREIGSGGGGVVYLAEHLRLHKKVVLKADKRTVHTTNSEALRQEVDVLKNLSHTYIPQVYDYFTEGDTVYTVIDYIEGESLDKPLKRKERFTQPQVVEWACQLLEALCYMHAQPPHGILHSDIKPANIMLTPQGDIRLIDFNIALALGEEGAVKVGRSRGYASPEHYGQSFVGGSAAPLEKTEMMTEVGEATEVMTEYDAPTEVMSEYISSNQSNTQSRELLLDVRSDIYCLGATLYHLLTGVHPKDAAEKAPSAPAVEYGCSRALSDIIAKAMAPNPAERFQTAAEMLWALEHLHQTDPRARRLKRRQKLAAVVCLAVLLLGGGLTWMGLSGMERLQNAYVLAEYSAKALQSGDVSGALAQAQESLTGQPTAQGQLALSNALGVYDLADGYKAWDLLPTSGEPVKLAISPAGSRAAALCQHKFYVFATADGQLLAELAAVPTVAAEAVFLSEDVLLYAGEQGLTAYDLAIGQTLWQGQSADRLALSADGRRLAAAYREETVVRIYDTAGGQILYTLDLAGRSLRQPLNDNFADTGDVLLALNRDGSRLAVSFADGGLQIFEVAQPENWLQVYNTSPFEHFEGGFYGGYFAFVAQGGGQSVFAVIDAVTGEQSGGLQSAKPFHIQADEQGVYLSQENLLVRIDPASGEQQEAAYTAADILNFVVRDGAAAVALADNSWAFYDEQAREQGSFAGQFGADFLCLGGDWALVANRSQPGVQVIHKEQFPEAQLVAYAPAFAHDEARLSADGQTVTLFDFQQMAVYALDGRLLAQVKLPQGAGIYDQQFRRDNSGSYLEVIYKDGLVRKYSAAADKAGLLLEESGIAAPDDSLDEEFLTDKYRVEAPLHGAPKVFDRNSGQLLRELSADAYLTYVTQIDGMLLTEYVAADGRRWGELLDENLAEVAYLPGLCDYLDGEFIFDYYSGYLRRAKLYTLDELLSLANNN